MYLVGQLWQCALDGQKCLVQNFMLGRFIEAGDRNGRLWILLLVDAVVFRLLRRSFVGLEPLIAVVAGLQIPRDDLLTGRKIDFEAPGDRSNFLAFFNDKPNQACPQVVRDLRIGSSLLALLAVPRPRILLIRLVLVGVLPHGALVIDGRDLRRLRYLLDFHRWAWHPDLHISLNGFVYFTDQLGLSHRTNDLNR